MGYTTKFKGQFDLTPALNADQVKYLQKFAQTRRMKRNPRIAENLQDEARVFVALPVGRDGEYFVGGLGYEGQDYDESIIERDNPPYTQPGSWCQWTPSDSGAYLKWDGRENFYYYTKWLEYLIRHFFKRWGIEVNGSVQWYGEEFDDTGTITVCANTVSVREAG